MFDEGGARHGIKTTNFTKVYNYVLRGARPLPLVGIIEFFMYRTMLYFHTRSQIAAEVMRNTQIRYCIKMTEYLSKAREKALKHKVTAQPLHQSGDNEIMWNYDVECEGKMHLGPSREKTFQVAEVGNQICRFTCRKPQKLHIPCSHVVVACYELQQFSFHRYVPWYYTKETVQNIWNRTIQGDLMQGSFTENPKENVVNIPNPDLQLCQGVGRRKEKRIRNNMDEAEVGPAVVMCYKCHNTVHTYKRRTATSYACNASPGASVGSSATSGPCQPPSGRGRGRGRGHRINTGFK
jgi:hypothetical protein